MAIREEENRYWKDQLDSSRGGEANNNKEITKQGKESPLPGESISPDPGLSVSTKAEHIPTKRARRYLEEVIYRNLYSKMNDLISTSFKKLNEQVYLDDLEAARGETGMSDSANLDKFFEDVENVKEDMKCVEQLHKRLQDSNEETKTAHNANTVKQLRSRMDADVEQVLKRVKVLKGKLEGLERSNATQRKVPGCGPGSSVDRTRSSVVSGLGKKLKSLMDDFQSLRSRMQAEYKETVERRYFTVTGQKPDDEMIENLISSGESESFLQKAIQEQGRGQILDTISEIQERHDAVKEIEKNLIELHQVFLDMAALVEAQGQQLNDIESHVAHASSFVRRGTEELVVAKEHQDNSRKWACYAVMLVILLAFILLFPFLPHIIALLS